MGSIQFSLFLYSVVTYIITYIVGHVLISLVKIPERTPFLREFSKVCTGFFVIITGYSIIKTNGVTINLGMLLLFFSSFYWLRKNHYLETFRKMKISAGLRNAWRYLFIQLIILSALYIFLFLKIYNPLTGEKYQVYGDFYNYSRNIQFLIKTGVESCSLDTYNNISAPRNLYHFGELWYSAFYSELSGLSALYTFYFILFIHVLVIVFLGAGALIETFFQPRDYRYTGLLSMIIFFTCGLSFYIPGTTIFTQGDWWDAGLLYQPKYFFTAIFIFYSIILVKHQKFFPLLVIAMATLLVNMVVAPAIFISLGTGLLLLFISRKITFSDFVIFSLLILGTLMFVGFFTMYIHALNDKNAVVKPDLIVSESFFDLSAYLKTAFNCFAGQFIKSMLSMGWFLLPFYFFVYRNLKKDQRFGSGLLFLLVLHLGSIISYAIFHYKVDAVQMWTIVYVPLSAISIFLFVNFLINVNNKPLTIFSFFLFVLCIKQSSITERKHKVDSVLYASVNAKYDGSVVVFFKTKDDFTSIFSKNINGYAPFPYLLWDYNEYNPVCLSVFEIPRSTDVMLRSAEEEIIQNSVFYRFVQLQKINKQYISTEQSQMDFIKKFKVKYAVTYKNSTLPVFLQPSVKDSIKDESDGLVFYTLNPI